MVAKQGAEKGFQWSENGALSLVFHPLHLPHGLQCLTCRIEAEEIMQNTEKYLFFFFTYNFLGSQNNGGFWHKVMAFKINASLACRRLSGGTQKCLQRFVFDAEYKFQRQEQAPE